MQNVDNVVIEKKSPRKGTKTQCYAVMFAQFCDLLKKSPQERGRKQLLSRVCLQYITEIEKKSPRKGTKTMNGEIPSIFTIFH